MATIIQIGFHLIKCFPSLNYANYSFTIFCDETKFNDTITFQAFNTIKDNLRYKTDLKYFLKVYDKGDLIGVGGFELLSEVFYRKEKKCLKEVQLTLPDKVKEALKKETSETQMMVKLLITLEYIERKIKSIQRQCSYDRNSLKVKSSIVNYKEKAPNQLTTLPMNLSTSIRNKKASLSQKKIFQKSHSIDSILNKQIDKLNEDENLLSNDNSVLDSIIARDDVSYNSEDENEDNQAITMQFTKSFNKKQSLDSKSGNKKDNYSYSNEEIKEKIIQQLSQFVYNHKSKLTRLKKSLDEETKMKESLKKYHEKYRRILEKEHNLMESCDKYAMKSKVIKGLSREMNEIIKEAMNSKQLELDICYCLLKDVGIRKREDYLTEKDTTEKEFLIRVFQQMNNENVNIASNISESKKKQLNDIYQKYNIITNKNSHCDEVS